MDNYTASAPTRSVAGETLLDIDSLPIPAASDRPGSEDASSLLRQAGLYSVALERHQVNNNALRWNTRLRVGFGLALMTLFLLLNAGVGWLVFQCYFSELELLRTHQIAAADRTITSGVFMALIGATVVQVGAGIATVLTHLFPKDQNPIRGTDG